MEDLDNKTLKSGFKVSRDDLLSDEEFTVYSSDFFGCHELYVPVSDCCILLASLLENVSDPAEDDEEEPILYIDCDERAPSLSSRMISYILGVLRRLFSIYYEAQDIDINVVEDDELYELIAYLLGEVSSAYEDWSFTLKHIAWFDLDS